MNWIHIHSVHRCAKVQQIRVGTAHTTPRKSKEENLGYSLSAELLSPVNESGKRQRWCPEHHGQKLRSELSTRSERTEP